MVVRRGSTVYGQIQVYKFFPKNSLITEHAYEKGQRGGIRGNKAQEANSMKAYPGFCSMKCIR